MIKRTILFAVIFLTALSVTNAQKRAFTIEDIYKIKGVGGPVLSNDGSQIAFSVTCYDLPKAKSQTDIYLMNSDGTNQRRLTTHKSADYSPMWSPDDKGIYFVSWRTGSSQVHYLPLDGGEAEQITDIYMGVNSPKLSPDGKYLVFNTEVFPECGDDEDCNKKIDEAMDDGPVQAHLTDSLFVRHWTEYADGKYAHIFVYDIENDEFKDITPGYYHSPTFAPGGNDDYSFSPDSKEIVFASKRVKNPEESYNSDLWTVKIDGSELKNITKENLGYDGHGKYSPDGKCIAYTNQLVPNYEADRFRLSVYNIETGKNEIITDAVDNWVNSFEWSADSKSLYFTIDEKGYNPLLKIDVASKEIERLIEKHSIGTFVLSPDENKVYLSCSFTHKPSEIAEYVFSDNQLSDLTSFNKELAEEVDIRPAEEAWVEGSNGKMVHVFIVKPHNFDPNKKYPLVINVHGGPQMQWRNSYRNDWQVYPGAGYVLAYPNPHGSTGYGQEFTLGISGDWNGKVYNDVMKVMDYLEELPYIDADRMGAMGWSYGGYFMNLLQAKGNRFKCLASMMGIYDLEQFYLETEELWFPDFDLKGDPWEQKELYREQSPSNYVENFKTPTLVITGERDYRVSYNQSLRYFTALQKKGVDSRLIIFDNDGHWPSHLKSMPLYYNSHLEWFHKYLGGDKAPWDSKKLVRNLLFE